MDTANHSKRPRLIFLILLGILIIGVVYFFPTIKRDIRLMEKVNPAWLLLSVLMQLITYLGSALIFSSLLKTLNTRPLISIGKLFQASIVVLFANQTIPSAGISGNTFFLRFLMRRKLAAQQAVWVISTDLLTFYFTMECIILIAIIATVLLQNIPGYFYAIFGMGMLVYALFAVFIWLIAKKKTIEKILTWLKKQRLFRKSANRLQQLFESSEITAIENPFPFLLQHKASLLVVMSFQLLIFLADGLSIFALFQGLSAGISFTNIMIGLLLTKIVALLPISPGALLVYESSMTFFFTTLGVPLGISILVTLLYRILSFWLPMPAGFFLSRKLEQV